MPIIVDITHHWYGRQPGSGRDLGWQESHTSVMITQGKVKELSIRDRAGLVADVAVDVKNGRVFQQSTTVSFWAGHPEEWDAVTAWIKLPPWERNVR